MMKSVASSRAATKAAYVFGFPSWNFEVAQTTLRSHNSAALAYFSQLAILHYRQREKTRARAAEQHGFDLRPPLRRSGSQRALSPPQARISQPFASESSKRSNLFDGRIVVNSYLRISPLDSQ